MKRVVSGIAFICILAAASISHAKETEYLTKDLYITSYYTVEVYHGNKKVGFLYAGVRAKILRTTKHWLYVEFWDGRKMMTGWIRR
jgi:hypothetical protein